MKYLSKLLIAGALSLEAFSAYSQEILPEGQNIINRNGAPTFTGGTTNSPSEYYASYTRNNRVQEITAIDNVYPNPARTSAGIVLSETAVDPVSLYVVNLNGTILSSYHYDGGSQRLNFDVSSLPDGLYSIHVQERGKTMQSIKLLKQN
jgi:hypothetical protein